MVTRISLVGTNLSVLVLRTRVVGRGSTVGHRWPRFGSRRTWVFRMWDAGSHLMHSISHRGSLKLMQKL